MREYAILLLIFSLIIGGDRVYAGSSDAVDTVASYFEACKKGDVEAMKGLISGSFYDSQKVLLTKNRGYPRYLKNFYRKVRITIVASSQGNLNMVNRNYPKLYKRYNREVYNADAGSDLVAVVTVSQVFPDGSNLNTEFLLKKDISDNWKIIEQSPVH